MAPPSTRPISRCLAVLLAVWLADGACGAPAADPPDDATPIVDGTVAADLAVTDEGSGNPVVDAGGSDGHASDLAVGGADAGTAGDLAPVAPDAAMLDGGAGNGGGLSPTLFGLHMKHADTTTTWPSAPFGAWRLWDAGVSWKQLEPSRGSYRWSVLDEDVQLAADHRVEIDMVLGLTPQWASARPNESSAYGPGNAAEPADMNDWRDFVVAVGTRYRGRITVYEIWNEPNLVQFYTGTVDKLVQMAQIAATELKRIDPAIRIVCPATTVRDTTWIDSFWSKGGAAITDVVGYHFYVWPGPPENMLAIVKSVQAVMAKHGLAGRPLWNTESGWYIQNQNTFVNQNGVITLDTASAYVVRSYALLAGAGVSRFYWYGWDDPVMGLTEADGTTVKTPGKVYATAYGWLVGATLGACAADANSTYVCPMTRPGNGRAWLAWNTRGAASWSPPQNSGATRYTDDLGGVHNLGNGAVPVGPRVVLVE